MKKQIINKKGGKVSNSFKKLKKSLSKSKKLSKKSSKKSSKKLSKELQFESLEKQEDEIFKEFIKLEAALKNIKTNKTNKIVETENIYLNGKIEKNVIESYPNNPNKKIRNNFDGCAVQTKTILYENKNDKIDKDEYYELQKKYIQCPKIIK